MREKILFISIICVIVVSFSINVFSVGNNITNEEYNNEQTNSIENKTLEEQRDELEEKIQESNTQLEYVQTEISATVLKIQELDDSINNYEGEINTLEEQITDVGNRINNINIELQENKEIYDKREKTLKKRVVAMYEAGEATYIDLLLSSDSIIDFISNYFMISELIEYDNGLLNEMESSRAKIESIKAEQEAKEIELRTSRQKINQTRILLQNTRVMQQAYMDELTEEEKKVQEKIEKYKEEQRQIENEILSAINWTGTMSIQFTDGVMIWPIAMEGTYITSGYGYRTHPIQGVYKIHAGIDISGYNVFGAPAVAAADGIVIYAGWISGYGNCVMINHGNGIISLYGHGAEIVTTTGATVKQGDIIMKVGSTGNSTGPHLHFEIRKNGAVVDPIPYLNGEVKSIIEKSEQNNTIGENTTTEDLVAENKTI